ncbi:MerR family transcriptional regulator [Catenuloplanes japonicus]|uniref:MerR family transcriptional regulator n=1 Tax=Catenuloplanes japonicus TaxID=33876 RepID=UPI0005276484|nr:MerR family transcriptional regulator [Catenuloplanes japonicus]
MRIGDLATRAGVSVRALRYYEEQGLLYATRSASGQRHYPEAAVDRVRLFQQLYAAGLSSRTIATLLPCVDANEPDEESTALLVSERDRIDRQIEDLIATRDRLTAVIGSSKQECRHPSVPQKTSRTTGQPAHV